MDGATFDNTQRTAEEIRHSTGQPHQCRSSEKQRLAELTEVAAAMARALEEIEEADPARNCAQVATRGLAGWRKLIDAKRDRLIGLL